jgi:hypothetical protein
MIQAIEQTADLSQVLLIEAVLVLTSSIVSEKRM